MKVALNARLLSSPTTRGWNRYTINLLAELSFFINNKILMSKNVEAKCCV
jgi:hypothetical protein